MVGCGASNHALAGGTPAASVSPSQTPSPSPTASASPAASHTLFTCSGSSSSPTPGGVGLPSPAATPTPSDSSGAIAGHVSTPSEVIVPQLVYAISTAGAAHGAYSTETLWGQSTYTINRVAPGAYYIYSARRPLQCGETGTFVGALYSEAVKCGLDASCTSHKPVKVMVGANATTRAIDVTDYYSPDPTIPIPPSWIVPADPQHLPPAAGYMTPRAAAEAISGELVVDSMTNCPVNRACSAVGDEHDGTEAAYFVGSSGSNADLMGCGTYVFHNQTGWHGLLQSCWPGPVSPAVGQSGTVSLTFGLPPSACANVRSLPGPKGSVVACLTAGTQVSLDSGPSFAAMAATDGLWWHIRGRGWIADDFLRLQPGP
jgi:hypothetical protein